MPRKVICGEDLLRASGTVMKKLSSWLLKKGYIDPEDAAVMKEIAEKAIRDLPAAERLRNTLFDYVESQPYRVLNFIELWRPLYFYQKK